MASPEKIKELLDNGFGSIVSRFTTSTRRFTNTVIGNKQVQAIFIDANADGTVTNPIYKSVLSEFPDVAEHFSALSEPVPYTIFEMERPNASKGSKPILVCISFSKRGRFSPEGKFLKDDPNFGAVVEDTLRKSLDSFFLACKNSKFKHVHVPQICSGKGGLKQDLAISLVQEYADAHSVPCVMHITPNKKSKTPSQKPKVPAQKRKRNKKLGTEQSGITTEKK